MSFESRLFASDPVPLSGRAKLRNLLKSFASPARKPALKAKSAKPAPVSNRRRNVRTSENDKPVPGLDGQYDIPPDFRPAHRHSAYSSVRSRTSSEHAHIVVPRSVVRSRRQRSSLIDSLAIPTSIAETTLEQPEDVEATNPHTNSTVVDTDVRIVEVTDLNLSEASTPTQRGCKVLRKKLTKPSLHDRYIGFRRPAEQTRDQLFMGKKASELSPRQRLLRKTVDVNPFGAPRAPRNRSVEYARTQRLQQQSRAISQRHASVLAERQELNDNVSNTTPITWDIMGSTSSVRAAARAVHASGVAYSSGDPARVYTSQFLYGSNQSDNAEVYEYRLATALDVDRASRLVQITPHHSDRAIGIVRPVWSNNTWRQEGSAPQHLPRNKQVPQAIPKLPFRVLEAPGLRDDYYCSALAYCPTIHSLAVALGNKVYLWSETQGVMQPPHAIELGRSRLNYITCLAFSSTQGGRAILAMGRGDGQVDMYSPLDSSPRFLRIVAPTSVTHLCFRPRTLKRPSQRHQSVMAEKEVLLVGDDAGLVSIYFVEWPADKDRWAQGWHGTATLQARISIHTQQICGIAWSPDGTHFATGGNDNICALFSLRELLVEAGRHLPCPDKHVVRKGDEHSIFIRVSHPGPLESLNIPNLDDARQIWRLNAAVKAIAFCPWQSGLMAAGGGSNDRQMHFFHTISGASLATIDCGAQVTSLVWSQTRREIAATFGFAQPEHPIRVAVYSWPDCQQVAAIPWNPDLRALYAIPYPGSPRKSADGNWTTRTDDEGCIVVAASDGSIKFHEIWSPSKRSIRPRRGLLAGSVILESFHGYDKEGRETIR